MYSLESRKEYFLKYTYFIEKNTDSCMIFYFIYNRKKVLKQNTKHE